MEEHLGIVACSAEGAALCYRTICSEAAQMAGVHNHPEISMHTYPLARYMEYIEQDNWQAVSELMLGSVEKLAAIGATFAICPDNTIHQSFEYLKDKTPIPWLHIAEEVTAQAKRRGYEKLAILGTKYLMEGPVYKSKCQAVGLLHTIPGSHQRERINSIIFDELVNGFFTDQSRQYFQKTIEQLKADGCDAVVLGCTEIPLIIDDTCSALPTLDSTRTLARAALRRVYQEQNAPA